MTPYGIDGESVAVILGALAWLVVSAQLLASASPPGGDAGPDGREKAARASAIC